MAIFFISLLVISLVIAGMAIGVILGKGPIKGSCGGLGAVGIDSNCEICGGSRQKCETYNDDKPKSSADLAYNADTTKD